MKHQPLSKLLLMACLSLGFFVLPSCQWENSYSDKAFLAYKYKLESCADIHGQDPYKEIWFSDYHGTYYSELFDLSFHNSYLDFRTEIVDNHAVGKGHLLLTYASGVVYQDLYFEYYCSATDNNWGGRIFIIDAPDSFGASVYSIYWCRLNLHFVVPDTQTEVTLTFNFRDGEWNSVPSEFRSE